MDHQQLIVEVTKQLAPRFMPVPQKVKKRIESLIEREYVRAFCRVVMGCSLPTLLSQLERVSDDRKTYRYLP